MIINPTITEVEELNVTGSTSRRKLTADISQPLDYAAKKLVGKFIENQQRTAPPRKSFIKKLLRLCNE